MPASGTQWERTPPRRTSPVLRAALQAGALAAVLVALAAAIGPGGGRLTVASPEPGRSAVEPEAAVAPGVEPVVAGGAGGVAEAAVIWIGVPDPPVAWIRPPQLVWTGREVLAWGAVLEGAAGAAYDPAYRRWRVLPQAPIEAREGHVAVWAGTPSHDARGQMVVWGGRPVFASPGTSGRGAAYDPGTNRWREIAAAPISSRRGARAVWTGRHVVVAAGPGGSGAPAGRGGTAPHEPAAAAYDPVADAWSALPAVPPGTWLDGVSWTGRALLAVLGQPGKEPLAPVATWDGDGDLWTPRPPAPVGQASRPVVLDTPRGPVLWVRDLEGTGRLLLFDPDAGRWAATPPAPLRDRVDPALAWTGRHVVVWSGLEATGRIADGALYDTAEGRWHRVEPGPQAVPRPLAAVWAGRELLVVGYGDRGRREVIASSWALPPDLARPYGSHRDRAVPGPPGGEMRRGAER